MLAAVLRRLLGRGAARARRSAAAAAASSASAAGRGTPQQRGDALEERVAALLRAGGALRVRRNLTLVDASGNRSQVDVAYGLLRPVYVECKAYAAAAAVPLEDAAKFKEVLRLHGLPPRRGLLVTTARFSPRVLTTGLRTVDGRQLEAWERRVRVWQRARWLVAAAAAAAVAVTAAAAAAAAADDGDGGGRWLAASRQAVGHAARWLQAALAPPAQGAR